MNRLLTLLLAVFFRFDGPLVPFTDPSAAESVRPQNQTGSLADRTLGPSRSASAAETPPGATPPAPVPPRGQDPTPVLAPAASPIEGRAGWEPPSLRPLPSEQDRRDNPAAGPTFEPSRPGAGRLANDCAHRFEVGHECEDWHGNPTSKMCRQTALERKTANFVDAHPQWAERLGVPA